MKRNRFLIICVSMSCWLALLSPQWSTVFSQTESLPVAPALQEIAPIDSLDRTRLSFEEKLKYYLNEKTQHVIEELSARETQLLQLVQNIHHEIALRGREGIRQDDPGFEDVEGPRQILIQEYSEELTQLLKIFEEMQRLQKVAEYSGSLDNQLQILDSKAQVAAALEDRALYKKGIYTPERVTGMVDEYTTELDSLLNMYDALEKMRIAAEAKNDAALLNDIQVQKGDLLKVLSQWGNLGPLSEEDFLRIKLEMGQVQKVVQEVQKTERENLGSETQQLRALQNEILGSIDQTIMSLMTPYASALPVNPTVTEFIDAWKSERLVDIEARLTEYKIIWQNLIASGSETQRDRMLSAEINSALLSYSEDRFLTAEYQFLDVIDHFQLFYSNLIPVKYYIAESKLHREAYDAAKDYYQAIISHPIPTPYRVESLVRMMQYEEKLGTTANFFDFYQQVLANDSLARGELLSYAHFLAANKYFLMSQFDQVEQLLNLIPEASQFHIPRMLLLATVYTNRNDYDRAIPMFQVLSDIKNYPWSDLQAAIIRNTALLRLGLIHYQRGQYTLAEQILLKVSPGFEKYDQALLARAWAAFREQNYLQSRELAYDLLRNFVTSDYIYEALILAAYCNRQLGDNDTALDSYRYIVRAHGILNLRHQYNQQRTLGLAQLKELQKLEANALDKRQIGLYENVNRMRNDLNDFLFKLREKGDSGSELIQDYYDERVSVVERMFELDEIVAWAQSVNRIDLLAKAEEQRNRLFQVVESFRADDQISNTAFLMDFPQVAKEASQLYRSDRWSNVLSDLNMEKHRIELAIKQIDDYQFMLRGGTGVRLNMEMEVLALDINNLRDRLSQLQKAMAEALPQTPKSNLEMWSDYSGFSMSDIVYQERKKRLARIDTTAQNLAIAERLLQFRSEETQRVIKEFEKEIKRLQDDLLSKKIQMEQQAKQRYFDNFYFDNKEVETETWEEQLSRSPSP